MNKFSADWFTHFAEHDYEAREMQAIYDTSMEAASSIVGEE